MHSRTFLTWALAVVLALGGARVSADDVTKAPTAEDIARAEKVVQQQLEKYKATSGQVVQLKDEDLAKTFSGQLFFSVLFRQYPVGRLVPPPLQPSNVFSVDRQGEAKLISDAKGLEKFFRNVSHGARDADQAKAAVRAWLRLSSQLKQDGFYRFVLMDDSTKVEKEKSGLVASGKMVVMQGGNGALDAKLTFDGEGKLLKIDEQSKIRPGPRPICQATKLLDKDALVRRMAEQDLLIMGRAARPYLDEQRAKASPALHRAIDSLWQRIIKEDR
jgi:hypothetical protein